MFPIKHMLLDPVLFWYALILWACIVAAALLWVIVLDS